MRPPGGGDWLVGGRPWRRNPRHAIPAGIFHIVRLWARCRGGMGGAGHLPEPGGINQQPAWLLAAFRICDDADHEIDKRKEAEAT